MIDQILKQISNSSRFPKTIFYNENWLLRIVLEWFNEHRDIEHPWQFQDGSDWYSEALLPSRFLPRTKGDALAEGHTHADGIISQFLIDEETSIFQNIKHDCTQLVGIEAKLGSVLSRGTTKVSWFDQAARNVAALIFTISNQNIEIDSMKSFGFYVVAPERRISEEKTFREYTSKNTIIEKIHKRIELYKEESEYMAFSSWFTEYVEPALDKMHIDLFTWESIVTFINENDQHFGSELVEYYKECLLYNLSVKP